MIKNRKKNIIKKTKKSHRSMHGTANEFSPRIKEWEKKRIKKIAAKNFSVMLELA